MPTYDYECQRCGHTFEHFQSFSEADLKRCPECRGKLKRLIGMGAGIIFKGPGFYETDYRSSEYKEKAKKEAEAASEKKDTEKKDAKKEAPKKDGPCSTSCNSSSGNSGSK